MIATAARRSPSCPRANHRTRLALTLVLLFAIFPFLPDHAFAQCRGIWSKMCPSGGGGGGFEPAPVFIDYDQYYRSYMRSAENSLKTGDIDAAQGWAEKALRERPNDPAAQALMAKINNLRLRQTGLRLNNDGLQHFRSKRFKEAAEAFRQALQYLPNDPQITRNQQEALAQMNLLDDYNRSLAAYHTALQANETALRNQQAKIDRDGRQLITQSGRKAVQVLADGCDGLACVSAKIAQIQGAAGARAITIESQKSEASIPWSDNPNAVIVIGKKPDGTANTLPQRPLDGPAKQMKQEIDQIWSDIGALDKKIAEEKDPIKRGSLIQQQTNKRSEVRVKEISYVTFVSRYAPDATTAGGMAPK